MPYSPGVSMKFLYLVFAVLMSTSCGSGPPPKLYLLESVLDTSIELAPPGIDALGLAMTTLPGYAKDDRVASRLTDSRLVQEDRIRWAESPEDAITRVLADRLRYYVEATVLIEPWPRGFDPQARVEVAFDKLLRDVTGGAELTGQIRVISGDGRKVHAVRNFQLVHYANDRTPSVFFAAVSTGINDIARMTTDILREFYK